MRFMEKIKLNPHQSFSSVMYFLDSIWDHRDDRFSSKGKNELGAFVGSFFNDPATPEDWRDIYKTTFGKTLSRDDLLSQEKLFTLTIETCALFLYRWGYGVSEALNLFYLMRYKPDECKKEWGLWQQAVQRTLNGEIEWKAEF